MQFKNLIFKVNLQGFFYCNFYIENNLEDANGDDTCYLKRFHLNLLWVLKCLKVSRAILQSGVK